jgi:maltooligosyltrehalose trehalohydrolase
MLELYRSLVALRRRLPQLTDPSFARTRCMVDEESRLFTMHRGEVVVVVNFGDHAVTTEVRLGLVACFETGSGVELDGSALTLPGHAGALLTPRP